MISYLFSKLKSKLYVKYGIMQYIVPYKFIYNSYSDNINFYMIFLFKHNWNDAKGKTLSL